MITPKVTMKETVTPEVLCFQYSNTIRLSSNDTPDYGYRIFQNSTSSWFPLFRADKIP